MQSLNKPIILFDIDYTLFDTAGFKESNLKEFKLYPEVAHTLEKLSKFATLGIFSEGEKDFQKAKLKITGIDRYFTENNIHISSLKETELKAIVDIYSGENLYVVDDKLIILEVTKNAIPGVKTIWVKRGEYANKVLSIPGFTPDYSMAELSQLISIFGNI